MNNAEHRQKTEHHDSEEDYLQHDGADRIDVKVNQVASVLWVLRFELCKVHSLVRETGVLDDYCKQLSVVRALFQAYRWFMTDLKVNV